MKKNINNMWVRVLVAAGCYLFPGDCPGQSPATQVKHIAANEEYNKAGKFKRFMFGDHYRKEWGTAVDVEILDMNSFAGGLTPMKSGGGLQTKSLRLEGANGQQYVLRSVDKDPSKALVEELRGTFAEDVVQDQISSSNPYAPMVVASLADAGGIFHSTPKLVYVPKSARLGEFSESFGETLCLLEERPSGNEENNAAFGYSKNVVNSEKLFEKLFSSADHAVDEKAFLKARLFDMLIGDWDRHEDQWMWASFKKDDKTIYQPIPRDRDQAFSSLDGLIPQMTTKKWAIRKVQDFDYTIHDLGGLNMNGRHLDRNFTTRLTLTDWLTIAGDLQKAITDEVIANAFKQLPDEIFQIHGKETISKLKNRRNKLHQYARQYYLQLSKQVNVVGTKKSELFEVTRINDKLTSVIVYSNKRINYYRTFNTSETKEIRLYGLDGNDEFHIDGETKKGIIVRVIGGNGTDEVTDESFVRGWGKHTKVYDTKGNDISASGETMKHISSDSLKNNYNPRGFKFDWIAPLPTFGYNPDDGLYLGMGVVIKKQQFGKSPYGYMQTGGGNYAFQTGAYNFWYQGIFKEFIGKWDLQVDGRVNAPNFSRDYFGLGNETAKEENRDRNYYRVRYDQVIIGTSLKRQLGTKHLIDAGIGFQSIKIRKTEDRFISTHWSKLDSADYERSNYGGVHITYQFSTLNNPLYPTKGIKFSSGGKYVQHTKESDKNYVQMFSEFASFTSFGKLTLASRTGFAANLGNDFEFFQANTLGNTTTLRGYARDRFAGKTTVYTNSELRYSIGFMNAYFVKGVWGLLAFADHGRVWMPKEESKIWHHGYGGGFWFLPYNKIALTTTYGVSKEDNVISVTAGFLF